MSQGKNAPAAEDVSPSVSAGTNPPVVSISANSTADRFIGTGNPFHAHRVPGKTTGEGCCRCPGSALAPRQRMRAPAAGREAKSSGVMPVAAR